MHFVSEYCERLRRLVFVFAVLWSWLPGMTGGWSPVSIARAEAADQKRPSLFLSCPLECFDPYLRQELSYFDFARDPHIADYTLVVVRQPSGSGGERFTVTVSPRVPSSLTPQAAQSFAVPSGTPAHAARQLLLQVILRTLRNELSGTLHETAFELSLPPRDGVALSTLDDPWNYWAIAPELGGSGEGGSGYYYGEVSGALTLRRVTELSKIRLRGSYARRLSSYRLEDNQRVRGDVYVMEGRALYAHSIGHHFALGGVVTGGANEFENQKGHVHGGPLAELNFFPYSENATRQLRLAYQAGAWANWYLERNEANLTREVRAYHALSLIADVNLPWGSIQWIGQANQFLDDPSRYRLSTGAILSLRLFEGLAFNLEGEAAYVRDLINIRKRTIDDVELLLWTAQQPTEFTLEFEFTLTYTFGSIHNTIVNPRFARVDLDEE
jgi:hypothetical protein